MIRLGVWHCNLNKSPTAAPLKWKTCIKLSLVRQWTLLFKAETTPTPFKIQVSFLHVVNRITIDNCQCIDSKRFNNKIRYSQHLKWPYSEHKTTNLSKWLLASHKLVEISTHVWMWPTKNLNRPPRDFLRHSELLMVWLRPWLHERQLMYKLRALWDPSKLDVAKTMSIIKRTTIMNKWQHHLRSHKRIIKFQITLLKPRSHLLEVIRVSKILQTYCNASTLLSKPIAFTFPDLIFLKLLLQWLPQIDTWPNRITI